MENLILLPVFLFPLAGLLYIALLHKRPFKGDWVIKAIPALSLAVLSIFFVPGVYGKILCAGFVLSAMGDISLCFEGEKYFIGGLVSFLLAHVTYIVTFAMDSPWSTQLWWLLGLIGIFGVLMVMVLTPHLGPMKIPVYVYISVILTMDVMAVMHGPDNIVLIAGALTFTLSDTILALNKFRKPVPAAEYLIMSTYYAGQALIFLGMAAEHFEIRFC
ncbi:MAG: lysoplasmalogenase [Bacteroidia bacterium]